MLATLGLIASLSSLSALADVERPRLVLLIVVDQLRGDVPARFEDRFGDGGLRRLRDLDRGRVLLGTAAAARDWTGALCASEFGASARVGGAWDGLAALRPSLGAAVTEAWSGCPDARSPR